MGVHRDKRSYVSRWDHCTIVSGVERSSFRVITRSRDIKALGLPLIERNQTIDIWRISRRQTEIREEQGGAEITTEGGISAKSQGNIL